MSDLAGKKSRLLVGFSGTQRGMTDYQQDQVKRRLDDWRPDAAIHGGCIGADDEFDLICAIAGIPRYVYPCTIDDKRVPDSVFETRTGSEVIIAPQWRR